MLTHYPDKPLSQNPCFLSEWDAKGGYICQQKIDGWRLIIIRDKSGAFHYFSRHNKSLADDISSQVKAEIESLPIPPDSQVDGEWIARRSCSVTYGLPEAVYLFDVLRWKGLWTLNKPLKERHLLLKEFMVDSRMPCVRLPPEAAPGSFANFFEEQRSIPHSEGVVVKHLMSKIVGDRKECKKNKMWYKVKWRGGSSGETDLSSYQDDIRNVIRG